MFLNKIYYFFKPYIPWNLRMALRRMLARRTKMAFADTWPIDEGAGVTPPGWPGWPEGKRFALILTHDVEGTKGLERVEQLMNLEASHGFRSSFNFVPEGEYRVPDSLVQAIDRAGFEVGVHGLEHDGKLYASRAVFAGKAARIKEYLHRWNASGFRSPLMQHRLAWLHELATQYDASTFDTDPFEPEPDGAGTIFPFWVPGPSGGYVELPYSLPQDFTLFGVLQERNIDIWKRKLDWIAQRGGMALLNTHPDYMCFNGVRKRDETPVAYYEEFLTYAREKYEGTFWSALPREVTQHYCANVPLLSRNSRKKICMVAYTPYAVDNRVRRYAETLARRGDKVDVIALTEEVSEQPSTVQMNGVTVYKIQHRSFTQRHKWSYVLGVIRFLVASSITLTRLHRRNRYDVIHVHNMPDFLVFGAWYPKLTGAKLILDIHDVVPELFVSKFHGKEAGLSVTALKWMEKMAAAFVDHVIVSNHLWHQKLVARSVPESKSSVFVNHADPAIFYRRMRTRNRDKTIIIFPGSFQWHQGLDIAIQAFSRVLRRVPNAELHLYGGAGGHEGDDLVRLVADLGLAKNVKFCGGITLDQIPEVIANADLGIVPKRADSFGNEAYSTKIMEFMSQGIPVVASRTKIDSFYFDETDVHFFASGDSNAMATAMLEVIENQQLRDRLITKGYEYVERNGWERKKREYLDLVDSLSTETFASLTADA